VRNAQTRLTWSDEVVIGGETDNPAYDFQGLIADGFAAANGGPPANRILPAHPVPQRQVTMPQFPYTPSLIELPVSDLHYGETLVKQKARFKSLYHEQTPEGESFVRIIVTVSPYAVVEDGGSFG
jgi:hypothetical protein